MPKKSRPKRTISIAIATVALIGSLGFAGTYAFAGTTGSDPSISACEAEAQAVKAAQAELDLARKSGDRNRIAQAEAALNAAKARYSACMNQ